MSFPTSAHEGARKDFIYIKEEDPANVPMHLEDIYMNQLKRYGISPDASNCTGAHEPWCSWNTKN